MRHFKHCFFISFLVGICALSFGACAPKTSKNSTPGDKPEIYRALDIDPSVGFKLDPNIYYNHDQLAEYTRRAYLYEDPVAMCITGMASFNMHYFDTAAQDSLTPVPLEDAEIMLLCSAQKDYLDAIRVIYVLDYHRLWTRSLPEVPINKEK